MELYMVKSFSKRGWRSSISASLVPLVVALVEALKLKAALCLCQCRAQEEMDEGKLEAKCICIFLVLQWMNAWEKGQVSPVPLLSDNTRLNPNKHRVPQQLTYTEVHRLLA